MVSMDELSTTQHKAISSAAAAAAAAAVGASSALSAVPRTAAQTADRKSSLRVSASDPDVREPDARVTFANSLPGLQGSTPQASASWYRSKMTQTDSAVICPEFSELGPEPPAKGHNIPTREHCPHCADMRQELKLIHAKLDTVLAMALSSGGAARQARDLPSHDNEAGVAEASIADPSGAEGISKSVQDEVVMGYITDISAAATV